MEELELEVVDVVDVVDVEVDVYVGVVITCAFVTDTVAWLLKFAPTPSCFGKPSVKVANIRVPEEVVNVNKPSVVEISAVLEMVVVVAATTGARFTSLTNVSGN